MIIEKKNIIRKELVKSIENITSSETFPWGLYKEHYDLNKHLYTGIESKLNKKYNSQDTYQLVHVAYKDKQKIKTVYFPFFYELFEEIVQKVIKKDVQLLRLKVNLLFKKDKPSINIFHLDDSKDKDYKTIIYYINDSDGDTVIYNKGKLKRISPKAGKVLLLDGDLYHASSNPNKYDIRKVININFKYV